MTRPLPLRGFTAAGLLIAGALVAGCHPLYVVVPQPRDGYSARDTLYGRLKGRDVRVTFRNDTVWRVDWRVDTVTRWRTIRREGSRVDTVVVIETYRDPRGPGNGNGGRRPTPRVDTVVVVVHDTVRVFDPRRPDRRADTVRVVIHDTVRVGDLRRPGQRVDTVRVVVHDTIRVNGPQRPGGPGGPNVIVPPTNLGRIDTVRVVVHDTVRVTRRDTVLVVVHDTVRVGGGNGGGGGGGTGGGHRPRSVFVPPGQYPPQGLCRLWIVGTPPGQQARPAACDALGTIPPGAFILFAGKAWDADYDWATDTDAAHVPPEILAIARQRHP